MIERVKRWLASCGEDCESRVGKLERPSAGRTRNLRVFFLFAFSLAIVLSERAKVNESQEHRNDGDRSRRHSAQKVRTGVKNRRKIGQKSTKIDDKSMKNRRKIALGQFWAFKAVSGTRRDALGTTLGRPKVAPRPILGRPGRAKSGQEPSNSVPGTVPRRCRTVPERCPTHSGHQALSNEPAERFFDVFWSSCKSSDVRKM